MSEQSAGLIVAHSHKLEELTDLVVEMTRIAPLAPLESECVLVQSNGIAQWLKRHWAESLGIAAMVDVTLPARFQWQAYRAVLGNDLPRHSPFDKDRLTWRLLRLLPLHLDKPEFAALANYIRDDTEQRKLYQLAERLADLYDQYQMYRADWLADWAAGGSIAADSDNAWQPLLWQLLREDIGAHGLSDRAQLHQRFIAKAQTLSTDQRPKGLPPRVIVFGISSMPQQLIEVLNALANCCQVLLCVHNPSQHFWMDSIAGRDVLREIKRKRLSRKPGQAELDINNLHTETHPLLASWGKQGGDYIRMLDAFDGTQEQQSRFAKLNFDLFEEPEAPQCRLAQLQSDMLHLRSIGEAKPLWEERAADDSLKFVSCHSPQREVEVLHDRLLQLFAEHDDVKPSDIIVMVPDVDQYAPHIQAVFGRYGPDDKRRIPFSIADQGMRQRHPILLALEYALKLNVERATASDLLDILQVDAVQQRFALTAADVEQLQRWLHEAGVRWGLHAEHREQLGLPPAEGRHSWWFGLRRMLLGYAVGRTEGPTTAWLDDEPYPEVGGLAAASVGGLQQMIRVLDDVFQLTLQQLTPAQWGDQLSQVIERLFVTDDDHDAWVLTRLQSQLHDWLDGVSAAEYDQPIGLAVVLESWLSKVDEHQLTQRFLAGSVNFATLMPMRAIPFKGVFLLGMNDGDYPRQRKPFDFDLMAQDSRPGDRSRREDDRYLFLEALLSARLWLYLSWCGRSSKDNSEQPPSVLVSQLRDHLQQLGHAAVIEEHYLQPFNPAYFRAQSAAHLFTYAQEWHALHSVSDDAITQRNQPLAQWLPAGPVQLRQLKGFLEEPARWFLQQRFQCYLPEAHVENQDAELFRLDGLSRWQLIDSLQEPLREALRQAQTDSDWLRQLQRIVQRLQGEGALANGAAGVTQQQQVIDAGYNMWQQVQDLMTAYPLEVGACALQYGSESTVQVADVVRGVRTNATGERVYLKFSASSIVTSKGAVRLEKLLDSWLEHLLLNTEAPCATSIISAEHRLCLTPMATERAGALLTKVLDWATTALCEPLPMHFELVLAGWGKRLGKGLAKFVAAEDFSFMNEDAQRRYDESDSFSYKKALRLSARYMSRFYPSFADIPEQERYLTFVRELYLPLVETLAQEEQA
ncbi:exodeoxyribonuclease V subunit gamma [Pseudidiomarina homiensis]|uniref:RecBCD enzyme subunit RecC n=1 Tax=Pseudidiomarina homiensis TaxID=364198 RepID=A0A432XXZ4_9GAMM|nr:exodeoxyribonuclease V subunit gamma [Pseudidiomarina homiensis]RUO53590.1 exodeoxyribonuclease V subunit gamma [Pseudidiomarina homiensis]